MSDSSTSATDYSPGMAAVAGEKGEKKGKNRVGSELAAAAAEEVDGLAVAKKKWRVPQDLIDFILAWDVSDYVFATPDDMPIPDEYKAQYRAERKQAVAVMQRSRRTRRKMQEWVRAELEKNGCVEVETTAEMLEKHHQLEEYIDGQIA
ncbi:uncharacterized protein [Miscanthus floridulus]|uniref:uncharacterized protein n=1 Tax=Miscanthus floridulus TaxID=154761 RepID=UPI00345B4795